ncbi:flavin reductase [Xylanimonas allomyrinae]|uniref:Flavin reductase n=1 Tax=Xylanimonas allomyrinae TaxID=2509459 RepID=A0A4V0YE10_9MICO|nr:flavin reductase family protein [Xylanimonas allomyrinae]QAY62581.1 flavin reductase [Xylanimonas allomyrinae]
MVAALSRTQPRETPESRATDVRSRFLEGFRRTAGSVTVVTTDGIAGRFGQTATAAMSVSADPPTLIVGLFRGVPVAEAVTTNGVFALNVLAADDVQIAHDFSGQSTQASRYKFGESWGALRTGSPVRLTASATFDCHVERFLSAGSHMLILGRVVEVHTNDVQSLTYSNRNYGIHVPFVR